jgi:ABC-type glycerol-3-phosphate transport system substrate-binding protein
MKKRVPELDWHTFQMPFNTKPSTRGGHDVLLLFKKDGADRKPIEDAAFRWVMWLTNKPNMEELTRYIGFIAARSDIDNNKLFENDPDMQLYAEQFQYTRSSNDVNVPRENEIHQAMIAEMQAACLGKKEPKQAWDDAVQRAQPLLEG